MALYSFFAAFLSDMVVSFESRSVFLVLNDVLVTWDVESSGTRYENGTAVSHTLKGATHGESFYRLQY